MRDVLAWRWRFLVVAFGVSTASCVGFIARQEVESARAAWTRDPSGRRATIYAEALHDAFAGQAYADQMADFRQRADEALTALGAAPSRSNPQLATLIADRGVLLLDLGRNREGWAELQRSMSIAPTFAATRGIVSIWGARGRSDEVGAACARTLPAMRDLDSRFRLLDLCVKNMHTATEAAALAWAPPEALTFYRDERARRDLLAQQAAQMAAMDQALQAAQAAQAATEQAQQAAEIANQAAMAAAQQAAQMATTPP